MIKYYVSYGVANSSGNTMGNYLKLLEMIGCLLREYEVRSTKLARIVVFNMFNFILTIVCDNEQLRSGMRFSFFWIEHVEWFWSAFLGYCLTILGS